MSQPSVASYFNSKKRGPVEDAKLNLARKVLILEREGFTKDACEGFTKDACSKDTNETFFKSDNAEIITSTQSSYNPEKKMLYISSKVTENKSKSLRITQTKRTRTISKKFKDDSLQQDIQTAFSKVPQVASSRESSVLENARSARIEVTPPNSPVKHTNSMDRVKVDNLNLKEIQARLSRSSRLAELKASMKRFTENAEKLKKIETKTANISESPKLDNFKTIELEVQISPQKSISPKKAYLSPKKDISARKNLFNLLNSPTKNFISLPESPSKKILESTTKPALTLPFKYRYLAEIFRAVDTICQIMYNRKETITFNKVKHAVEEMLKRNLTTKHIAQIKTILPNAYELTQVKLKSFASGKREEKWELVIKPLLSEENMTPDSLLKRRRELFNNLLEKTKIYHKEFLESLDPPMKIPTNEITRWHPEFDIEKVPDIDQFEIPQPPHEDKLTTGKEVLEKARQMFNCNTRMEQALERLRSAQTQTSERGETPKEPINSVLKGIPKALLEKVRQKQAAKALISMTRSADKDKELQMHSRLPELVRLIRNLFVAEKKSVLPLDTIVEKLGNCYQTSLSKCDMEAHIRLISNVLPDWLVLHEMRHTFYVKIMKNADVSIIVSKLEAVAKEKSET